MTAALRTSGSRTTAQTKRPANAQEADCRKLGEAKSWEVVAVYKDLQSAWSDKERPDFERMLRDAKCGPIDVLLVWKYRPPGPKRVSFERAVRSLTSSGIEFASLSESVDTTTPMGKFTLHLTGGTGPA